MSAPLEHHNRSELCTTRPRYRQGRNLTSVKVYTVCKESKYLLLQGVPSVASPADLLKICVKYGVVEKWSVLGDYPHEEFTQVVLIKYKQLRNARAAKRKLDDSSFYGGVLHVCYAPEHETVADTRDKLHQRRVEVARQIRKLGSKEEATSATTVRETASGSELSESDGPLSIESHTHQEQNKMGRNENESEKYVGEGDLMRSQDHKNVNGDEAMLSITKPPPPPPPLATHEDTDLATQSATNQHQPLHNQPPPPPPRLPLPPPPGFRQRVPVPHSSYNFGPPPRHQASVAPHRQRFPRGGRGAPHLQWYMNNYSVRMQYPSQIPAHQLDMREHSGMNSFNSDALRTQLGKSQASCTISRPDSNEDVIDSSSDVHLRSTDAQNKITSVSNKTNTGNKDASQGALIIKEYKTNTDKQTKSQFVPRQTKRRTVIPENLLQSVTSSVQGREMAANGSRAAKRKPDPVNEKLRMEAFILGQKKAGPKLLSDEEREAFEDRETALAVPSIDKTMQDIRSKVLEFSAKAMPPQLKRAKRQKKS